MANDPYTLDPELWFGLLCESVRTDEAARITLQRVASQFRLFRPPTPTGIPPHARVRSLLLIGLIGGMGQFTADITLESPEGKTIWTRPEPWSFSMGGAANSAVLVEQVDQWITEAGTYRFWIKVRERQQAAWPVRFEVAEQIGPPARSGSPGA